MTIQPQTLKHHQLHQRLHHVKALRDDIRLKAGLFESDVRTELAELETRIERMERELAAATDQTVGAVARALEKLSEELLYLRTRLAKHRPS